MANSWVVGQFDELMKCLFTLYPYVSDDQWGNASYGTPRTNIKSYASPFMGGFGSQDGHGQMDNRTEFTADFITYWEDIKILDKIVYDGVTYYVADVKNWRDEDGILAVQEITVTTMERQ